MSSTILETTGSIMIPCIRSQSRLRSAVLTTFSMLLRSSSQHYKFTALFTSRSFVRCMRSLQTPVSLISVRYVLDDLHKLSLKLGLIIGSMQLIHLLDRLSRVIVSSYLPDIALRKSSITAASSAGRGKKPERVERSLSAMIYRASRACKLPATHCCREFPHMLEIHPHNEMSRRP